jgi:hypothetical protein
VSLGSRGAGGLGRRAPVAEGNSIGILLLLAASAAGWIGGCAYSFTGTNLPSYVKTIAIPNFEDQTLEPGLGAEVTSGVIDRFIKDGRLKLAADTQANSRLEAKVVKYENKVHNYAPDQTPQDYIVVLTVAATLRDQVKNRDLWKDENIVQTAVYVPGATGGTIGTEADARAAAIKNLASDLVTRTLEQW